MLILSKVMFIIHLTNLIFFFYMTDCLQNMIKLKVAKLVLPVKEDTDDNEV